MSDLNYSESPRLQVESLLDDILQLEAEIQTKEEALHGIRKDHGIEQPTWRQIEKDGLHLACWLQDLGREASTVELQNLIGGRVVTSALSLWVSDGFVQKTGTGSGSSYRFTNDPEQIRDFTKDWRPMPTRKVSSRSLRKSSSQKQAI